MMLFLKKTIFYSPVAPGFGGLILILTALSTAIAIQVKIKERFSNVSPSDGDQDLPMLQFLNVLGLFGILSTLIGTLVHFTFNEEFNITIMYVMLENCFVCIGIVFPLGVILRNESVKQFMHKNFFNAFCAKNDVISVNS